MARNGGQKDAGKMRMVKRIMSLVLWRKAVSGQVKTQLSMWMVSALSLESCKVKVLLACDVKTVQLVKMARHDLDRAVEQVPLV